MTGDCDIKQLADTSRVDIAPGFFAITRSERLRDVLEGVLAADGVVTAAVHRSVLIGYAVDLPFVPVESGGGETCRRWNALPAARELGALEVARPFRGEGIARRLLEEMLRGGRLDGHIVVAEGLHWHWDVEAHRQSIAQRRASLLALLGSAGFEFYDTDEPEVSYSPANFLAARAGPRVPWAALRAFETALFDR